MADEMNDSPQSWDALDPQTKDAYLEHIIAAIHHGAHPLSQPGGPLGETPQPTAAPSQTAGAVLPKEGRKAPSPAAALGMGAAPSVASAAAREGTKLALGAGSKAVPIVGPVAGSAASLGMQAARGEPITGEDVGGAVGGAAGGIAGGAVGAAAGAASGAGIGAAAGTVVPGIGNVVGALVGLGVGAALSYGGAEAGKAIGRAAGGGKARLASGRGQSPFGSRFTPGQSPFEQAGGGGPATGPSQPGAQ